MVPKSNLDIICTVITVLYYAGTIVSGEIVRINATQTTYVEVNKSLVLSCSYEGNLTPKACYFWRNDHIDVTVLVQGCQFKPSSSFTVTCVGINICVFTLLRTGMEEHGINWQCSFRDDTMIKSDTTEIRVKVPVSTVILLSPTGSQVTLTENSTQNFRCKTSIGRPIPTLSWFMDDNTPQTTDDSPISQIVSQSPADGTEDLFATTGSLTYKASRLANGKYVFCQTRDVDGNTMVSDRRIQLNVTYKPDRGPLITEYNNNIIYYAITNKPQALTCTIPGGNPLASLSWSCFTGNEENLSSGQMVSKRWTWRASSNGTCTCTSTHLGVNENVMLNVAILSPPTYTKFTLHSQTVEGKTTVKIIRDSTEPIICTAESFPAPDKYTWKYDGHSSPLSQVESLYPSQMAADGRYFCEVGNKMSPTQGQIEYGSNSSHVDIQRLFAPVVKPFSIGSALEGDPFLVECKTVQGKPAATTYSWKRKIQSENVWTSLPNSDVSGSHLTKQQISRHDAGIYNCTASNVMKPTAELQQIGSSSDTFILNVLYKTSISRFIELNNSLSQDVTVSEHSSIHLQCEVDSNPGSTIFISKDGETKVSMENRKQISYINSKVACDTAGTYKCIGYNAYNIEDNKPSTDLKLFVTCSPRLSSKDGVNKNINSALKEEAILKIGIIAYPVPKESDYTWWKWNGETWDMVKTDNNIHINTSGLESSVIFHSVQQTDYQRYRLNVSNDYGHFHQEVFLNPYEMTTNEPSLAALIGGAIGGSVAVIILIAVIVVLFLRRSSFTKGMQDNPMYVPAGSENVNSSTEASSSGGAVEYSTVNKAAKAVDIVNDNEYAVVSKPQQAQTKPAIKEKKHGFLKDKKGKKATLEGDIDDNFPGSEMKIVTTKNKLICENPETSAQTMSVNKDGLLYADLSFNDQPKGQRKLVIHGLDNMTEYVEVDFTKKADPLPDSDDETIPQKN